MNIEDSALLLEKENKMPHIKIDNNAMYRNVGIRFNIEHHRIAQETRIPQKVLAPISTPHKIVAIRW